MVKKFNSIALIDMNDDIAKIIAHLWEMDEEQIMEHFMVAEDLYGTLFYDDILDNVSDATLVDLPDRDVVLIYPGTSEELKELIRSKGWESMYDIFIESQKHVKKTIQDLSKTEMDNDLVDKLERLARQE